MLALGGTSSQTGDRVIEKDHVDQGNRYRAEEGTGHEFAPIVDVTTNQFTDNGRGDGLFPGISYTGDRAW